MARTARKPKQNPFQTWLDGWMAENQLTNLAAAEIIGVNDSLIGHYLRGTRMPTYSTLAKIKAATGVDMDTLF